MIIKSEYARNGKGPRYKTPVLGLGMLKEIKIYFFAAATASANPAGS